MVMKIIPLTAKARLYFIIAPFVQIIALPHNRGNMLLEYKGIERFITNPAEPVMGDK
jgi:hypothetical protein